MELPKDIKNEIWEFCRVNDIPNIDDFILKLVKQGFTVEKFDATPESRVVEKIVEKIVEVPVEKIVEKIVELPVELENDELSQSLNDHVILVKELRIDLDKCRSSNDNLRSELELEKQKNKKDFYGER